ncbi:Peroxidasin [Amphibalanus amphitrite]|uniref:peroxidase n=1 Tax=Amphibalanus amphitrite TaxID=1232801 RepID=A0A6A4VDT8_AMPAM|nr:Peroxidasin [Amphibalanus amphitrite]
MQGGEEQCCQNPAGAHCLPMTSEGHCQQYKRSMPSLRSDCRLGPREQLNMASAFLDASALYGTDKQTAKRVRSYSRGQLRLNADGTLPRGTFGPCSSPHDRCPEAADRRAATHAGTTALYTLLTREHNRLAGGLADLNPQWSDEVTFQAARQLLTAELQHITFNQFLPAVLGQEVIEYFQLSPGVQQRYTLDEEPAVTAAAATAALHFYLALLPDSLHYQNRDGAEVDQTPLSDSFFSSSDLYRAGRLDQLLLGLSSGPASQGDSVTEQVTKALDLDLLAYTIQQGRDHGLPGYGNFRNLCGLTEAHTFDQLNKTMTDDKLNLLRTLYSSPSEVDLFVGGMLESPLEGAVVGPTFACILGQQFRTARRTDRFWYESDTPPAGLSKEQLYEIRKASVSRLLCDNVDSLQSVAPNPFLRADTFLNAPVLCNMLPAMNLLPWKVAGSGLLVPEPLFGDVIGSAKSDLERRRHEERLLFELGRTSPSRVRRQLVRFSSQLNGRQGAQGFGNSLRQFDVSNLVSQVPIIEQCRADEETVPCDPSAIYRTYSGYCNNLNNPNYGKSVMPQNRLLPAKYDDGISRPRQRSVTGQQLPSPRLISTSMHSDVSSPHTRYTMILMQFGQFLDHDISLTPIHKGFGDSILNCRDCDSANRVHPECWPIRVPENDPYFPPVDVSSGKPFCIAFTRSLPGQQSLGPREQLTQNTAFLDASHIYGQQQCEARALRSFNGGRLVVTPSRRGAKGLPPTTRDNKECRAPSGACFAAGDNRASEQPGLATLHTMWIREHNRVAKQLANVNPHWDDEKLYQVGRRIVTAAWEHITYNEFLPRVLGWNAMQLYDLRVGSEGFFKGYDSSCSAAVLTEFSSAAFRFGHSLIRPDLKRMDVNFGQKQPDVPLRGNFFNSDVMFDDQMVDDIMRGLISTPMENLDNHITGEVTKHLFEESGRPFSGLDLVSLNIQRARDHGIPAYNDYRAICNLKKASTFDDLSREIPRKLIEKMKQVYAHVDDIDLFSGGLSETPLQGGLVGPTFGCIIGLQFRFLKKCDRFWYETDDTTLRFTEQQLAEIRKVTMSRIMCQNCDQVDAVQRALFDMPQDFLNPRIPCRTMPDIDFQLWREGNNGGGQCNVNGVDISAGSTVNISPCTRCSCNNGQTTCQSVQVTSCQQLVSQSGRQAVLDDTSCRVQCLSELGDNNNNNNNNNNNFNNNNFNNNNFNNNNNNFNNGNNNGQLPPKNLLPPTTSSTSTIITSDSNGNQFQQTFVQGFQSGDQSFDGGFQSSGTAALPAGAVVPARSRRHSGPRSGSGRDPGRSGRYRAPSGSV